MLSGGELREQIQQQHHQQQHQQQQQQHHQQPHKIDPHNNPHDVVVRQEIVSPEVVSGLDLSMQESYTSNVSTEQTNPNVVTMRMYPQ